jgi:DNA replication ATP-dependent helicase Dna2
VSLFATAPPVNGPALDVKALLEGAENWDWADMEDDFLTPKKPRVKSKVCHSTLRDTLIEALQAAIMPAKRHVKQTCTRCVVDDIREDNSTVYQKVWKLNPARFASWHDSSTDSFRPRTTR